MRVLVLGLMLSGCQCLQPVVEDLDGGRDAGRTDGGVAACRTASDCPSPGILQFCTRSSAACVDGRCLQECNVIVDGGVGRVCTSSASPMSCLRCDLQATQCAQCGRAPTCSFTVPPDAGCAAPFLARTEWNVVPTSQCSSDVLSADGGTFDGGVVFGTWARIDDTTSLALIPALGGACVVDSLYTGLPRALISCPSCTFITVGCE